MNQFTVILGYDMIKYNRKYDDIKGTFQREWFCIKKAHINYAHTLIKRTEVQHFFTAGLTAPYRDFFEKTN